MPAQQQSSSSELPLLKGRTDLLFTFQSYGGQPGYLVEDPANGAYFRMGVMECSILKQLDGSTPLEQAAQQAALRGDGQLDAQQLPQLANWLLRSHLAYIQHPQTGNWQLMPLPQDKLLKSARYLNFLFIRIPLGSPDRLLERLLPWFQWMLGGKFFLFWAVLCISVVYHISSQWPRFLSSAESLFSIYNALWLLLAWIIIKTIHELFHGLICKRYGGHVHEAGIFLILFTPIGGYVDATSSWRFTSRWQRIHVAVAGIFIELFLAAVGGWIWAYTDAGPLNYLSYNMVIIAGVGTLAFNANPLMRFDGYYILSDLLHIPNLYPNGQLYIRHLVRRYLMGLKDSLPQWDKAWFIKLYGITTWIWRILIMIGLLTAAMFIFQGAGIVISVIAIITWLVFPLIRFFKGLRKMPQAGYVLRRLLLVLTAALILAVLALVKLEFPSRLDAPGVVDYAGAKVVRAETPGFVKELLVESGGIVTEGQPLLRLENIELVVEEQDLALQIRIHEQKAQSYFKENLLSAYQIEQEKLQELESKWRERRHQVEQLNIYASLAGYVIADRLDQLHGAYLQAGAEILTIGNPHRLEVKLSIAQDDIDFFRAAQAQEVEVYFDRHPMQAVTAILDKVNPAAHEEIQYPALTALGGGPLLVQPRKTEKKDDGLSQSASSSPELNNYQYLQPRFEGTVLIPLTHTEQVKVGETATVVLETPPRTLWTILYTPLHRYWSRLMASSPN